MKIILSICSIILFCSLSFGQKVDNRLLQRYSQKELSELSAVNPEKVEMLEYALDNAIYIIDIPSEKNISLDEISVAVQSQTYIDLGLEITNQNQYFRVAGENKMLVVKSEWVLLNEIKIKK